MILDVDLPEKATKDPTGSHGPDATPSKAKPGFRGALPYSRPKAPFSRLNLPICRLFEHSAATSRVARRLL